MARFSLQIIGLKPLQGEIQRENRKRPRKINRGIKDAAKLIQKEVRGKVPVRTGALRRAYTFAVKGLEAEVGAEKAKAFYAHMVERGTRHSRKRPHFGPAVESTEDEVFRLIGRRFVVV